MSPSTLRDYAFARVKDSPKLIPFLVYLHPPPVHRLTSSQNDYWVTSLVAYYPEELKDDVLEAIATDPDRTIPLIPFILSKISAPRIILESQTEDGVTSPPADLGSSSDVLDPGIRYVPPPSVLTASTTIPGGIVFGNHFGGEPDSQDRDVDHKGSHPNPTIEAWGSGNRLTRVGQTSGPAPLRPLLLSHPEAPSRSSEGPNAGWMTIVGRDPVVHADPGSHPFCPACVALQAEINTIRDAITIRVDQDMYHLLVSKMFLANVAYGFMLGAFSFLGLLTLSYSPRAAFFGSLPLSLALLLVFGIPV